MRHFLAIPALLTALTATGVLYSVTSTTAWAADYSSEVTLKINRIYTNNDKYFSTGRPTVIVTLTNRSAYRLNIRVKCAFLMDEIPVATAIGVAMNVSAGSSAIEDVFTFEVVAFDSATCRVSGATR